MTSRMRFGILLCLLFCTYATAAPAVVGVLSHDIAPYRVVWDSFQTQLSTNVRTDNPAFDVRLLQDGAPLGDANSAPRLVLAVGSNAAHAALQAFPNVPLVATLILNPEELANSARAVGVLLDFPASIQWRWFRRVLPNARRVGVLLDPRSVGNRFRELEQLAKADGLNLISVDVTSPEALPTALRQLPNDLDALWGLASPTVLAPQTAKEILLYSFRNRVPFIGLSANWVKAGALYALDRDYTDLGRQCAELAEGLLNGTKISSTNYPRRVQLFVNLRTAEHMRLSLPDDLLNEAAEQFQ